MAVGNKKQNKIIQSNKHRKIRTNKKNLKPVMMARFLGRYFGPVGQTTSFI